MTEEEWLACDSVRRLLESLGRKPSRRKLRLFACACSRRALACRAATGRHSPWDAPALAAIEAAERHAEGEVSDSELKEAFGRVESGRLGRDCTRASALSAAKESANFAYWFVYWETGAREATKQESKMAHLGFARCVFSPPSCRKARGDLSSPPAVHPLAEAAYDERSLPSGHLDNARLAILSDALEEAGCTDEAILTHLRSPGPHVRGCWALDLVLGKQ